MFNRNASSYRVAFSQQQLLQIAKSSSENARNSDDLGIALAYCHDAEGKLSQAKRGLDKNDVKETVAEGITAAYIELGQLFESSGYDGQACFKEAQILQQVQPSRSLEAPLEPTAHKNEGFSRNGIGYIRKYAVAIYKEQDGRPVVEYIKLIDGGSWKDVFFDCMEMQLLHEASPLTRNGNQNRFTHRSLLEYGLARTIFDPQDRKNLAVLGPALCRRGSVSSDMNFELHGRKNKMAPRVEQEPNPNSLLVWRSLINDHSLMQFLEERFQQEPVFKHQLLAYIEQSKNDMKWRTAAANTITILVRAGVQFVDTDFRGIQIPGAHLSYGLFDSVQFHGADLRKVNLRGTWLRKTDLSKADMTEVQFGELRYIAMDNAVETRIFSPAGKYFAVGQRDGKAHMISTSNCKKVQTLAGTHGNSSTRCVFTGWNSNRYRQLGRDHLCLELDHRLLYLPLHRSYRRSWLRDELASASHDKTIRLWNLHTGECHKILSGHTAAVFLRRVFTQRDESDCLGRLGQYNTPVEHYDGGNVSVFLTKAIATGFGRLRLILKEIK
ncbi:MAG: hypothetical protein J3Q66DRAFT_427669 [Benniella sp.]|nr:MAG: hypothetical protein J3Q66DRAFT_427669 [Benniella sp.]